jgi:hypothetical protein
MGNQIGRLSSCELIRAFCTLGQTFFFSSSSCRGRERRVLGRLLHEVPLSVNDGYAYKEWNQVENGCYDYAISMPIAANKPPLECYEDLN